MSGDTIISFNLVSASEEIIFNPRKIYLVKNTPRTIRAAYATVVQEFRRCSLENLVFNLICVPVDPESYRLVVTIQV